MVSLATIEQEDGVDRQFEGAGLVAPYSINEEDEGQEDGLDAELQYVRLGAILRYTLDYAKEGE
jgi:DNA (cytosine-5)-methyltransferase 1